MEKRKLLLVIVGVFILLFSQVSMGFAVENANGFKKQLAEFVSVVFSQEPVPVESIEITYDYAIDGINTNRFVCYKVIDRKIGLRGVPSRSLPGGEVYFRDCVIINGDKIINRGGIVYGTKDGKAIKFPELFQQYAGYLETRKVDVSKLDPDSFLFRKGETEPFFAVVSMNCPHCQNFIRDLDKENYTVYLALLGPVESIVKILCAEEGKRVETLKMVMEGNLSVLDTFCPPDAYKQAFDRYLKMESEVHKKLDFVGVPFFIFGDGTVMSGYNPEVLNGKVKKKQ